MRDVQLVGFCNVSVGMTSSILVLTAVLATVVLATVLAVLATVEWNYLFMIKLSLKISLNLLPMAIFINWAIFCPKRFSCSIKIIK